MYGYSDDEERTSTRRWQEEAEAGDEVDEEAMLNERARAVSANRQRTERRSRTKHREEEDYRSYDQEQDERGPRSKRAYDEEYERRYREKRRERRRREREEREEREEKEEKDAEDGSSSRRRRDEIDARGHERRGRDEDSTEHASKPKSRRRDIEHNTERDRGHDRHSTKRDQRSVSPESGRARSSGQLRRDEEEHGSDIDSQQVPAVTRFRSGVPGSANYGGTADGDREQNGWKERAAETSTEKRGREGSPVHPATETKRERGPTDRREQPAARSENGCPDPSRRSKRSPSPALPPTVGRKDDRETNGRHSTTTARAMPTARPVRSPASKPPAAAPPPPPSDLPPSPPPPSPPPTNLSKMDRYFDTTYDPRLDLGEVPAEGMIAAVGWDNMLAVLKERGRKSRRSASPARINVNSSPKPRARATSRCRSRSPSPATVARRAARKARKARQAAESSTGDPDLTLQSDEEKERARRKEKKRKEREKLASFGKSQRVGAVGEEEYAYVPKGGIREWDLGK